MQAFICKSNASQVDLLLCGRLYKIDVHTVTIDLAWMCCMCVCVCVCVGVSSAEWERGEVRGSRPEAACRVAVFTSYRRSSLHHSQRPPGGVCECRSQPHHTHHSVSIMHPHHLAIM